MSTPKYRLRAGGCESLPYRYITQVRKMNSNQRCTHNALICIYSYHAPVALFANVNLPYNPILMSFPPGCSLETLQTSYIEFGVETFNAHVTSLTSHMIAVHLNPWTAIHMAAPFLAGYYYLTATWSYRYDPLRCFHSLGILLGRAPPLWSLEI
jgi:hypothetical protein